MSRRTRRSGAYSSSSSSGTTYFDKYRFEVEHALCVIDREAGAREALEERGIELLSLFTRSDLEG